MHFQRGESPNAGNGPTGFGTDAQGNAPGDERAGTWVRVAGPAAGANWGALYTPRIGSEVTVQFVEGDIDRPVIAGGLYEFFSTIAQGVLLPSDRNGMEDDYVTKWSQSTYADALRGLSLYDQGLARLRQGDRGVFLHHSRGLLEDAANAAKHQYEIYYMSGPKGGDGMVFYGKHVPAMKAALLWATEHGAFNALGLQPAMAELSAPSVWTMPREERDEYGHKMSMPGSHVALMEATAHVKELPRVPVPIEDVLVQTGEPCPVFGIYEPQVRDGMMAYMCQGQEAYRYGTPCYMPRAGTTVTWKLVWEDTRYRDGVIPEEEKDYFPDDNTPPDFSRLVGAELAND